MMNHHRALMYLKNTLGVALAAGLLLVAAPAAARPHGDGPRGGGHAYSDGGDRGGNAGDNRRGGGDGGHRPAPAYNRGGGDRGAPVYRGGNGYRPAPAYNRGGGYRGAPVYRGGNGYHPAPTYNNDGRRGFGNTTYNNRGGSDYGRFGHRPVNVDYARYPNEYHGDWDWDGGNRWYNGYWHNYWDDEDWLWWGDHYGFWFPYGGINVFVYEASPDYCDYWDGYEWVPYYDPETGFYCPY